VSRLLVWADDLRLSRVGPPESVRERPWSTIVRISTPRGPLWLKAAGPGCRYEPALLAILRRYRAPHTVLPLAVDEERGLSVLPHAGEVLRDRQVDILTTWQRLLMRHGTLQRLLEPAAPELLAREVPDQRPAALPEHLDRLLADPPQGLGREALHRLRERAPAFRRACEELAAFGIEPTLQHDDLHDGNVLVDDDGTYRVTDWGDAAVAHPFGVLLVTLNVLADRLSEQRSSAALRRLQDAYLEGWTDRHSLADLRAAAGLAAYVARVGRCLSWQRALLGATDVADEFATAPGAWLTDLLASGSEAEGRETTTEDAAG
jgi:Ser/Thr protein kinase RdoA (MazF antagonist)